MYWHYTPTWDSKLNLEKVLHGFAFNLQTDCVCVCIYVWMGHQGHYSELPLSHTHLKCSHMNKSRIFHSLILNITYTFTLKLTCWRGISKADWSALAWHLGSFALPAVPCLSSRWGGHGCFFPIPLTSNVDNIIITPLGVSEHCEVNRAAWASVRSW